MPDAGLDPEDHTLIVANIVGQMPWTVRGDHPCRMASLSSS